MPPSLEWRSNEAPVTTALPLSSNRSGRNFGIAEWTLKGLLKHDFKLFASDAEVIQLLPPGTGTPPPHSNDAGERETFNRNDVQNVDDEQGHAEE